MKRNTTTIKNINIDALYLRELQKLNKPEKSLANNTNENKKAKKKNNNKNNIKNYPICI